MIPLLETSSRAAGTISVPPPRFNALKGRVTHVNLSTPPYQRAQGLTDAQKNGLRYEEQVQEFLLSKFESYLAGPSVHFMDGSHSRLVKPDGILPFLNRVFVFEIKFQHVPEAWWQLEKLYKVVLDGLYHRPISLVEICRSYDPATPFPCPVELIPDLESWVSEHRSAFGVYQWRKSSTQ